MYDSPITKILTDFTIDSGIESGKKLDEAIAKDLITITKKYDLLVDEKGLIDALKQDQIRYEEAYNRGYDCGYRNGKFDTASKYTKEVAKGYVDIDGAPHCSVCDRIQSFGCNYCDFCGRPLLWDMKELEAGTNEGASEHGEM